MDCSYGFVDCSGLHAGKNKNKFNVYFYLEEGNIYQFENINLNLDSLTLASNYKKELINLNKTYYEKNLSNLKINFKYLRRLYLRK